MTTPAQSTAKRRDRSPLGDAMGQLLKNKLAVGSALFILLLVVGAVFADYLNGYVVQGYGDAVGQNQTAYSKQILVNKSKEPGFVSETTRMGAKDFVGFTYVLGSDNLGRDLWSRTLYGARISMAVALVAAVVSLTIGVIYGLLAGYIGGRVDDLMMRFVDFMYGLPTLIVVILMQVYFKSIEQYAQGGPVVQAILDLNQSLGGILFVFIALGALNWLGMARIARAQTLSVKEKEYIEASRAVGTSTPRLIFSQILPNILGPCIVYETLQIPNYILTEAFLSFIGLGANPPHPSWGIMINEAYQALRSSPHELVPPAVILTMTVLAFNFLGDGLRDAFDPRLRGE